MRTRDEVLREFGVDELVRLLPMPVSESVRTLADEISALRSQLAAALLVNSAALDKAERERDEARRERDALRERVQELEAEEHTADHIINLHGKLLTEIANAIKGEPEPLTMHSHHDLPELVLALRQRAERMERVVEAAKAYEKWMGKWHDYTKTTGDVPHKVEAALINAVRAAINQPINNPNTRENKDGNL